MKTVVMERNTLGDDEFLVNGVKLTGEECPDGLELFGGDEESTNQEEDGYVPRVAKEILYLVVVRGAINGSVDVHQNNHDDGYSLDDVYPLYGLHCC